MWGGIWYFMDVSEQVCQGCSANTVWKLVGMILDALVNRKSTRFTVRSLGSSMGIWCQNWVQAGWMHRLHRGSWSLLGRPHPNNPGRARWAHGYLRICLLTWDVSRDLYLGADISTYRAPVQCNFCCNRECTNIFSSATTSSDEHWITITLGAYQ